MSSSLLTTVPVSVAALHAAADLLELVGDFLAADPGVRTGLGGFVDPANAVAEGVLSGREFAETAHLLRAFTYGRKDGSTWGFVGRQGLEP